MQFKELISENEIKEKVALTGKLITEKYKGEPLLFICLLKGAFVFLSDLVRAVDLDLEMEFMVAKSYEGTKSSGNVTISLDIKQDISRYHVIIAEDIIDTGRTLKAVKEVLEKRNPKSLKIITLLDKPARRVNDLRADLSLFTIEDKFVVGYGLDYNGLYRNLPYIATSDDIN